MKIIGGYYDEEVEHWVDVYEPEKDKHKPKMSISWKHLISYKETVPTLENILRREIMEFLMRKEVKRIETAKERSETSNKERS